MTPSLLTAVWTCSLAQLSFPQMTERVVPLEQKLSHNHPITNGGAAIYVNIIFQVTSLSRVLKFTPRSSIFDFSERPPYCRACACCNEHVKLNDRMSAKWRRGM